MPVIDIAADARQRTGSAAPASAASEAAPRSMEAATSVTVPVETQGWAEKIAGLKKATSELREERQRVAKELKAAQRKNKRLKERARTLSEEDMMQILVMKRAKKEAATEVDPASSSAEISTSASSASAASAPELAERDADM